MAMGALRAQYCGADLSSEMEEEHKESAEAAALHERFVSYVHALSGHQDGRRGVWGEHSYARPRSAPAPPAAHVRVLLAPPPAPPPAPADELDVESAEPAPREPLADAPDSEPEPEPGADDEPDWEARVEALAPSAPLARLARAALHALRRLRLQRLARAPRGEAGRGAARRLRLALAAAPGAPAAWLHAALAQHAPRRARALYDELLAELRRSAPRAAERLAGPAGEPAREPDAGGPAAAEAGPWLVWVSCGRSRAEARWCRRLRALVHTRLVRAPAAAAASPERWCAAVAGGARSALADVLLEAGERAVFVGGAGAGAALAAWLAEGSAGALLLAPALLTAEGARSAPDDALRGLRVPVLLVAGSGAAQSWRGAARAVLRGRGGGARRLLEVRGADDALRVPRALRMRLRLPQRALDAAIAEECARWMSERAEAGRAGSDEEEAPASPPPAGGAGAAGAQVTRGPAATPLALLPPRRLGAADILRLPVVFADDAPGALTVTAGGAGRAGAGGPARVLLAKRRAPAPAPRPVLLRRGLRLVPRDAEHS